MSMKITFNPNASLSSTGGVMLAKRPDNQELDKFLGFCTKEKPPGYSDVF